ncbi:MAG: sugar phosphate nucleotidyltransferase [Candidatus Nanohaloarchaea archaeon]|nr:sugar phosphate nucleotidyltransferase [Candidatus Nanohaloarchaea archaeon]
MKAVLLAGGTSSRFWPLNTRHKSLVQLQGKPLIRHTLDSLVDAGVDAAVIVQGPEQEIQDQLTVPREMNVRFAVQEEPRGMGNALAQAEEHLEGEFLVTGPYRFDAGPLLKTLRDAARSNRAAVAGVRTETPEEYGVLETDGATATGVVEKPDPGEAPSDIRIVSTYLLDEAFFDHLEAVEEHEYSFEDALDRYMADESVGVAQLDHTPPSLKYPWDVLDIAEQVLGGQGRRIADSADIADSATVEGDVVIEENATVYENAVIRGPCYIGENCTIGNNALVRAATDLEAGCRIGANMEIRGTVAQDGLSTHSGFIGDSVIGRDVSVGAGTVTANRRVRTGDGERPEISVHVRAQEGDVATGRDRLGALIGDRVDIGTQANLMPGVCVGSESFIGPSALVRSNVGETKRYFTKHEGRELER